MNSRRGIGPRECSTNPEGWSTNRFRVLLEEGRAGDYLSYMRTSTRVTTGAFFNSFFLTLLLIADYYEVPWRLYFFAPILLIVTGLSYGIASDAFDLRMAEAGNFMRSGRHRRARD